MEIDWLKSFARTWLDRVEHGRVPHAVLLAGPVGVGKRDAARWMARTALRMDRPEVPEYGRDLPEHPDLRWIRPPEDKEAIGIEQIRDLVDDLGLTS